MSYLKRRHFLMLCAGLLAGCGEPPEKPLEFEKDETELLISFCLDTSGSFEEQLVGRGREIGKGYKTFSQTLDRFHRDHQQTKNRLVMTRIYGAKKSILIDAEPQSFLEQFPTHDAFKDFLLAKPDPGGSRVYDAIRDTVEYIMLQHKDAPKMRSMILIYSDMDSNVHDSAQSKELLVQTLKDYAKIGGVLGIYGCEINTVPEWSRILRDCRFKSYVVEPDIKLNPKLPILN